MVFVKPGSGSAPAQQQEGYRLSELEGCHVLLTSIKLGNGATKYSDGEKKDWADADVTPLDGPFKGKKARSRVFAGYVVSDLKGLGEDAELVVKVQKGSPREGLREGWLIVDKSDDEKIMALAEKALA